MTPRHPSFTLFPYTTLFRSLDRIDLHLEVPAVKYRALADQGGGEPSEAVRERVDRARAVQRERFATRPGVYANAHMAARDRSEEHTSELQSHSDLVCRLLLE